MLLASSATLKLSFAVDRETSGLPVIQRALSSRDNPISRKESGLIVRLDVQSTSNDCYFPGVREGPTAIGTKYLGTITSVCGDTAFTSAMND